MMCTTFKYITNGPIRGILKLFFQTFIMHRNGPGTSCTTFSRHKRPGRSDRSAGMATSACANAGRGMHGSAALEDQGPALCVMYTVEQARGGGRSHPGLHGQRTVPTWGPPGASRTQPEGPTRGHHTHPLLPAIQPRRPRLRTHGSCARALWRERTRSALTFARVAQKLNRIGALSVGQLFTLRRRPFCDTC